MGPVPSRFFLMLFAALAMLLSPPMQSAQAQAMDAGTSHSAMAASSDHCSGESDSTDNAGKGKAGSACCVASCAAAAVDLSAADHEAIPFVTVAFRAPNDQLAPDYLAELPTPPPRRS